MKVGNKGPSKASTRFAIAIMETWRLASITDAPITCGLSYAYGMQDLVSGMRILQVVLFAAIEHSDSSWKVSPNLIPASSKRQQNKLLTDDVIIACCSRARTRPDISTNLIKVFAILFALLFALRFESFRIVHEDASHQLHYDLHYHLPSK